MDLEKVAAIKDWPTPTNRKQLQQFLWFTNFYRKFIKSFSSIVSRLDALTSSKIHVIWTKQTEEAFKILKERFTTAPVLALPDPSASSWWSSMCPTWE